MRFPVTRRDTTTETLHGHEVADPYRWLEDPESDDTRAWVVAAGPRPGFVSGVSVGSSEVPVSLSTIGKRIGRIRPSIEPRRGTAASGWARPWRTCSSAT